jgi:hypothetical protein
MDFGTAKRIIEALADGIDPRTGEVLDPGSPMESANVSVHCTLLSRPSIIRSEDALAMPDCPLMRASRGTRRTIEYLSHCSSLAGRLTISRTLFGAQGSIAARLVRLGKIPDRQSALTQNSH